MILILLIAAVGCFRTSGSTPLKPFVPESDGLPEGFVAGPPLTEKDFKNPPVFIKPRHDGERSSNQIFQSTDPSAIQGDILGQNNNMKNGITSESMMWPGGVIPYVISAEYDDEQRRFIAAGMNEYHTYTCITFTPRVNEADYIVIMPTGTGCTSYVGRTRGAQTVSLDAGCLRYDLVAVVHELMHAAGFHHEQGRYDRDEYVIINWDNIQEGYAGAFDKLTPAEIQFLGTLYDYPSVMHYRSDAFAIDPSIPTITANDGSKLGSDNSFSATDALKLNRLYGCDETDICWDDDVRHCPDWVAQGLCTTQPQEMIIYCRKSCNFCDLPMCYDSDFSCPYWAANGECESNPGFMLTTCKRACKVCL